ncbi:xylosyltransferase 1-like [Haliotis rubra]|uniref:xylosyltransferase 1-like n=1 Tax=Haliotis rubra TaxID=36100 RepID=UPI001EE617E3|nr:xylosyltransferase 1-like [Haliotis rubra]
MEVMEKKGYGIMEEKEQWQKGMESDHIRTFNWVQQITSELSQLGPADHIRTQSTGSSRSHIRTQSTGLQQITSELKSQLGASRSHQNSVSWAQQITSELSQLGPADHIRTQSTGSSRSHQNNYEQKPIFFARKFEPIVNQEIINSLDVYLFGNFQQDMTGLTSYWQNEYHHLDKIAKVKDAYPTFYQSFVRLGVAELSRQSVSCTYRPMKTLEANVFYEADHFHGILVLHEVEEVATGNIITMETHMHPKHHYSILQPKTIIGRLQTLEVGTDFDPKELLFRNYGKLIGPYDDVVLRHVWGAGIEFVISVAWIDPVNVIAASYDVKVLSSGHTGSHKPQLNRPLRPGIWQVKLMYNLQLLAETSFLVIPLTVYDGHPISAAEIYRAHSGPQGFYASKDFSEFRDVLNVPKHADLQTQAAVNAKKVGKDLENWVDSLVPLFWQVQRSCTIEDLSNTCLVLEQCKKTSWSSRSPDPKSDLSSVGAKFAPVR